MHGCTEAELTKRTEKAKTEGQRGLFGKYSPLHPKAFDGEYLLPDEPGVISFRTKDTSAWFILGPLVRRPTHIKLSADLPRMPVAPEGP